MPSKKSRDKWNAEHYVQINISVDKQLAGAFKAACADKGVSLARAIKSFMRMSCNAPDCNRENTNIPAVRRSSRTMRRKEAARIAVNLERMMKEEEEYLDRMPENLRGSARGDAAEVSIAALSEAIDLLYDAY